MFSTYTATDASAKDKVYLNVSGGLKNTGKLLLGVRQREKGPSMSVLLSFVCETCCKEKQAPLGRGRRSFEHIP